MPHLINGIGTWYLGKKNLQQSDGKCEFCGSWGKISSYETRLWVLVFFIPVIPVQRKQIIDDCPRCRRHRSMPLSKWKEVEANALREKMQEAEQKPDDPKAMLQLLGTMIGFRRQQDALQLADVLQADFPDNLEVQTQLGSWHASEGRLEKSRPCFRRVLELDSENLYAKQMVALELIDAGDLPHARELLRGMDVPGPNQSPQAMLALADAYQKQLDHAQALECYRTVLQMYPPYEQDKSLRKRIRQSEEALGATESLLPKRQWKLGPAFIAAACILAIVLGALAINYYKTHHQPLHIVNQLNRPVTVAIDGGKAIEVPARNRQKIAVAEGVHRALVRQIGEPDETIDFSLENSLSQRFSGRSVFVLNPGGAAVIIAETVSYFPKNRPMLNNPSPRNFQIHFGEKSATYRDIDYIFQQPPQTVGMGSKTKVMTKSAVNVCEEDPMAILDAFPEGTPPTQLADFVESQLKQRPDDEPLLRAYVGLRGESNQLDRCREFLAGGLAKRPICIEWHRSYQQICQITGRDAEAEAEYRKMLEAEPKDSALLYLMGRVAADPKEKRRYFEQAAKADKQNAYPRYAIAYDFAMAGDFSQALPLVKEACRLKPGHPSMEDLQFEVRFALKDYAALERELKEKQTAMPLHYLTLTRLMQVQAAAAAGAIDRARQSQSEYARQCQQGDFVQNPNLAQLELHSRLQLHYLEGDMQAILSDSASLRNPAQISAESFIANLELGILTDAEAALPVDETGKTSSQSALLLSLAWSLRKGNGEKADFWRKKAIESMKTGSDDEKRAAALLELKNGDSEIIADLALDMQFEAVWLAALADVCKEHRQELLDHAEKLNINTYFPHRFLKRTIEKMKAGE